MYAPVFQLPTLKFAKVTAAEPPRAPLPSVDPLWNKVPVDPQVEATSPRVKESTAHVFRTAGLDPVIAPPPLISSLLVRLVVPRLRMRSILDAQEPSEARRASSAESAVWRLVTAKIAKLPILVIPLPFK